ncbi:MAG TPA: cellulase family glycosylhydrolase [Chthonomonadales bacterium]|nr:cellulase family glycosylhydrolase [Chthonomonadales bacterium]
MPLSACIVLAALVLTASAARGEEAAPSGVTVRVMADGPAIVRETPARRERLVPLWVANPGVQALSGLKLTVRARGRTVVRDLLDVPPGGAHDTVWLPDPAPQIARARLTAGDRNLWAGDLAIPRLAERAVIPHSPRVPLGALQPLMLRGLNYYPRSQPWPGIWRAMDEAAFEAEFREMGALHINTIRIFTNLDAEAGLHTKDGAFTPLLLSRIHTLLTVAARHRVKVMLTIGAWGDMRDLVFQRRYFRTVVEPFTYDGRLLAWDLINEPGGDQGPKATPELARWITTMWEELRLLAPRHMLTVGLCWQFDQLWDLGVRPPLAQYHHYSGAAAVQPPGQPPVRNNADDLQNIANQIDNRPLVIGEFGYSSQPDANRKDASEARQLTIVESVLAGAEEGVRRGVNLSGVYLWCAFHFVPDWMGPFEQGFGVIRPDGSLKPAGALLRDTYARWRSRLRAPWEAPRGRGGAAPGGSGW